MRTFELEKEINTILKTVATKEQLLECYAHLGERTIELEIKNQALMEAVSEVVSEEQAVDISTRIETKIDEHLWRNTSPESREQLFDYGYKKPVVLCDFDEACDSLVSGDPVYLLNPDNTEKIATSVEEIEAHVKKGGLCGLSQLTVDFDIEYVLGRDQEQDYE